MTPRLKDGERAEYWGESANTGYKRGMEHVDGLKNEKAPLWRHASMFHGGEKNGGWNKMKVERTFRTALARQISEGI